MIMQPPSFRLLFILLTLFILPFSPSVHSFSDSLFARLHQRLQYLVKVHSQGNGTSSSNLTSSSDEVSTPPPLLIERVIERLHDEKELAFDQIVPEAAKVLKKLGVNEEDLKDCYDERINDVKVNLFKRRLGDVVRHFFKLYQEVLEDGLLSTILHRIRALVNNIRFIARATVRCLLDKSNGLNATRIGLTPLSAYTHDEFISKFLNPVISRRPNETNNEEGGNSPPGRSKRSVGSNSCSVRVLPSNLPASWDWRTYRVPGKAYSPVTPIRSQGPCSSCFVFASVGAMESVFMLSPANQYSHQQTHFSEQELLNCFDKGCGGGFPKDVYQLAIKDGLVARHSQPYTHTVNQCEHDHAGRSVLGRPSAYCEHYGMTSDVDLQSLVYQYGPVVSAINTNDPLFQFLLGPWNRDCRTTTVDHAVLTVGYTQQSWLIKNSWGKKWGVDGYLVMPRDNTDRCGIYYQGSAVEFEGGIIRGGTGGGTRGRGQQTNNHYQSQSENYARFSDFSDSNHNGRLLFEDLFGP